MEQPVREQVVSLLRGGQAHMPFAEAVKDFPKDGITIRPPHVDYTFWHLVEHIRITQHDILDFCLNPEYKELEWPKDYWPDKDAEATYEQWQESVKQFENDLQAMIELVQNPDTDLSAKIPHGGGQTYLREALLIADHTAYHTGELGILRQVCELWK
jgi:hypothetical protein